MSKKVKIVREIEPKIKKIRDVENEEERIINGFSDGDFSEFEEQEPVPAEIGGGALERVHETSERNIESSVGEVRTGHRGDKGTEREFNYTTGGHGQVPKVPYNTSSGETSNDILRERSLSREGFRSAPDIPGRARMGGQRVFEDEQDLSQRYKAGEEKKSRKRTVGPWE